MLNLLLDARKLSLFISKLLRPAKLHLIYIFCHFFAENTDPPDSPISLYYDFQ